MQSTAPPNCLQYFLGPTGEMTSFNYESIQHFNPNTLNSPDVQSSAVQFKGIGYMNDLDYTICFRKEQFFCSQTYTVNNSTGVQAPNDPAFSIRSSRGASNGRSDSGKDHCPDDYLLLNGIRFCGHNLNTREQSTFSEPITDDR